ncbi:MAG TPA: phosphatidylglycerol lysyltransferase domain-containing protein [Candidatus Cloacimonadota bacterium]|nr:phosphatidylglycerol lysyltransferase domain-containing protein [Candidatus Cloacimonadota bacterium]HPS39264.1 phosphatidylglycerol lysyltransferase domain-containing protein [Candidatus Cloacimonadota bacterium]
MLKLESLNLSHKPVLEDYLARFPRESCDYSVANLYAWGKIYDNQIAFDDGNLILFNPKYSYICFPLGESISVDYLVRLVKETRQIMPLAELILIPEDYLLSHPGIHDHFEVDDNRGWADYVHSVQRLAELKGKKLAKKKNLISQYTRAYPDYRMIPITKDKAPMVIEFTKKWRRERDAEGPFLDSEFEAILNTFEMWDDLPVEGLIVCHQHSISAYSVFSPLTADMAAIHYEKFDPDMKGSAQLINWETAKYLQGKGISWINREQDLGIEGLRKAKMSYDPDHLIKFITSEFKS